MAMLPTGFVDRNKGKTRWDESWSAVQTNIVASATVSQAAATPLTAQMCFLATVASAGNAIRLPAAAPGMEIVVVNQTANAAATYPAGTDTINGGGAGASVALPTGTGTPATAVIIFYCGVSGQWWSK